MSIHNILDKIKAQIGLDHIDLSHSLIIILVGISAFGLGRLSVKNTNPQNSPLSITTSTTLPASNNTTSSFSSYTNLISTNKILKGKYVASKNGKLYYALNCTGVKRIKESNKVWFDTVTDAEKLGYSRSASCK